MSPCRVKRKTVEKNQQEVAHLNLMYSFLNQKPIVNAERWTSVGGIVAVVTRSRTHDRDVTRVANFQLRSHGRLGSFDKRSTYSSTRGPKLFTEWLDQSILK